MFDLTGKVAIVTGGNGGLGLGMARGLAGAGARVVVAARNAQKSAAAVAELRALGPDPLALAVDVTDEQSVSALVAGTLERCGRLDILVDNAGINIRKPPQDFSLDEWRKIIDTNLTSAFLCARAAYAPMKQGGGGKIINVGSMFSTFGSTFASVYSASKGGVVQLTRSLAVAWAPDNIQVNAVLPGWIDTDLTRETRRQIPGLHERVLSRTPAGRWGSTGDLAGIAVFLCSAASDYITGTAIPVDGGLLGRRLIHMGGGAAEIVWQQNYAPLAQSLGWSALVASLPIFVLLYLLAWRRKPAWIAAIAGLGAAVLVAALFYRMPPGKVVAAGLLGGAFGLLPIGWITFNAVLLFRLTVATGQFEGIKISLARLTTDRRLSALLIAFAFGALIEGAAGSGVPVAVGAAMLTSMGFDRLRAAGICLLANTAPVAFGAIGLPVLTLAVTTGLPVASLSAGVGRLSAPLSLCVPAYMVVVIAGWKGLRGALPAALVCGLSFAVVQRVASSVIGPELTDVLASLAAMACLVGLFRVWQPRDHAAPTFASPAVGAPSAWRSWMPYLLLAGCVLLWGSPPVKAVLRATSATISWPALHNLVARMPPVVVVPKPYAAEYRLDWLASAGTACLLASLLSAALVRMPPRQFRRVLGRTARQMFLPLCTIASVLALAFVMNYSGATATLGLAFAGTGILFPFFSAILGWVGVFLTGSDSSSNALFGNLQVITAGRLGLDPVLTASANAAGGVLGKMISLQSIAVAAAATGMSPSEEGQLFRFTFWHSAILVAGMGALTTLYAYAISGFG